MNTDNNVVERLSSQVRKEIKVRRSLAAVLLSVLLVTSLVAVGVGTATATPTPVAVPGSNWGVTLGTTDGDVRGLVPTDDGGLVVVAFDRTPNGIVAVKLDENRNEVWRATPAAGRYAYPHDAIGTSDDGTLIVGSLLRSDGAYVAKLNAEGAIEWDQTLSNGGTDDVWFWRITETDAGYLAVGAYDRNLPLGEGASYSPYAALIAPDGSVLWERVYESMHGQFHAAAVTSEGDGVAVGFDYTGTRISESDGLFVRFDSAGELVTTRTYDAGRDTDLRDIRATPDGFLALGEYNTRQSFDNALLLSLDEDGLVRWSSGYDAQILHHRDANLLVSEDGSAVFATDPDVPRDSDDPWRAVNLVWVDPAGSVLKAGEFGTLRSDVANVLAFGPAGEIVVGGDTFDRDDASTGDGFIFAIPPGTGGPTTVEATALNVRVRPGDGTGGAFSLGNVLWIGGVGTAVLVGAVAVLLLRRRRGRRQTPLEPSEPPA